MNLFLSDVAFWWRSPDCVDFLIGVCSITRSSSFFLLGCFLSPYLVWSARPHQGICITGGLEYLCQYAPPPTAHFIGVSWLIPAPRGGALPWESSISSWTARFFPSWFLQGVFVTLFVVLTIKELLGLTQVLTELGTLDTPVTGFFSDRQTWYVYLQYV